MNLKEEYKKLRAELSPSSKARLTRFAKKMSVMTQVKFEASYKYFSEIQNPSTLGKCFLLLCSEEMSERNLIF